MFKLLGITGEHSADVLPDTTVVIGRAGVCDLRIDDPSVSRRHAQVTHTGDGLFVRELGSSNGTFLNGGRVMEAALTGGDVLRFGNVEFYVHEVVPEPTPTLGIPAPFQPAPPETTIVLQVPVKETRSLEVAAGDPNEQVLASGMATSKEAKLGLLLEISKELAKQPSVDHLLRRIVDITFRVMSVDRVSILRLDVQTGALVPATSHSRFGDSAGAKHVPRSIARRCVDEGLAILTHNAAVDDRFRGQSIVMQNVQSAMAAPLLESTGSVMGLLYVDNLSATDLFGDEDLDFLIAFSGIAAVAIENSALTERVAREAVVLSNFQRFFAPDLAAQIVSQGSQVQLGGTKRPVVVFFSDIRGFTPMSEGLSPDQIASLLTEYFTEMVDVLFENGGTLDKFMGDAIMALWGAPIQTEDDADRAVRTAVGQMKALAALNRKWAQEGRPTLDIGIGINYGEVFAGNIGSERRMEYTVLGDAVNVASRLCSKARGGEILISDALYRALREPPVTEQLDPIQLRGKADAIDVHRVMAFPIVEG